MARSSFSPARKVRSSVVPVLTFFKRVRTKAEPFAGLDVQELDDGPELAVDDDGDAVTKIV